jgi:nucleoside-diphosphate-sugar epimerase
VVGESFVGVYGAHGDGSMTSEDAALPPVGRGPLRDTVLALRSLEQQLRDANQPGVCDTTALRIGFLYGRPVPSFEGLIAQARRGRLLAPRLAGVAAFVHIVDAAAAIVAAVEQRTVSRVYNIVDDEPLPLAAFMSALAAALGTRPPRPVPRWLVRLAAPLAAELGSAPLRLSNARARRELGWAPRYPTIRSGLAELAHDTQEAA